MPVRIQVYRRIWLTAVVVVVLATVFAWRAGAGGKRVRFVPRFATGDTLRYQIESRTTTTGKATEPIQNPEGNSRLKQTANLVVKLEVLGVDAAAVTPRAASAQTTGGDRIHMRATYEKASAKTETDAYDPTAQTLEEQYNRLEGRAMEFTVEPDGKLSDMKGMDDVLANPSTAEAARSWMTGIASGGGFPKEGIVPGQRWTNEKPLEGAPLAGLVWHTESTYLRDEDCTASAAGKGVAAERGPSENGDPRAAVLPAATARPRESCAVVLTRFEIVRKASKDDQTPEDFRKNGLRTSGTWTGSGQSLDSISLTTSLLMSSTQTSVQEMNLDIVSPSAGSKIHYQGKVESESEITLLLQEKGESK